MLRKKLIIGFLIPCLMLMATGFWSSYRIRSLSRQVNEMQVENERSIRYAVQMNDAIERMDSGILLKMHGDVFAYQKIFSPSASDYRKSLQLAAENVTLPGEMELLDTLIELSNDFFNSIEKMDTVNQIQYYYQNVSPVFNQTQHAISNLRLLNTNAMIQATQAIADQATRAALPGDMIVLAAVVFFGLFGWLTQTYIVKPIRTLHRSIEQWRNSGRYEGEIIETGDEIQQISEALIVIFRRDNAGKH